MLIYHDRLLETSDKSSVVVDAHWHPSYSVLAVASFASDGEACISFYTNEGSLMSKAPLAWNGGEDASMKILAVRWHPSRKILALGCESGDLFTWNDYEQELLSCVTQHVAASVRHLCWSCCGSRLVSADEKGALVAWKADSKGKLDVVFHHELKDRITHVVYRRSQDTKGDITGKRSSASVDVGGLARAAVGGDESALDLFSTFRMPHGNNSVLNLNKVDREEDDSFYVGTEAGTVYFVDGEGSCVEVVEVQHKLSCLLFDAEQNFLIIITDAPSLIQYAAKANGSLSEVFKVKLAYRMLDLEAIWTGNGLLSFPVTGLSLRFWDVRKCDGYSISMEGKHLRMDLEHISSIAYNEEQDVVAAGTNLGNIHMWLRLDRQESASDANWLPYCICSIKGAIMQLAVMFSAALPQLSFVTAWSGILDNLAVNASTSLYMLSAQKIGFSFKNQVAAVQIASNRVVIEFVSDGHQLDVVTDVPINGVDVTARNLVVWSGTKVKVFEVTEDERHVKEIASFPSAASSVAVYENSLYAIESGKVQVRTFQGTIKQSLGFLEGEGQLTRLCLCNSYLVASSTANVLKIWEISRREAKPLTNPKLLSEFVEDQGEITSLSCNCSGNKVCILLSKDDRVIVWDVDTNEFMSYDFQVRHDADDFPATLLQSENCRVTPVSSFWNSNDSRFLVCELSHRKSQSPVRLASFYVTTEHGIIFQDSIAVQSNHLALLGITVPFYYFINLDILKELSQNKRNVNSDSSSCRLVDAVAMKDFCGLENDDNIAWDAMMDFGFYLTIGNMDEAFKSIKKVKSVSIWENMARMCVKTKRLDVAAVCLGNMGHARGAKALRESMDEPDVNVRVACLAVHLGMLNEAEQLYRESGRDDLLNRFYQACGQWDKALGVAERGDRIHLRSTHYNHAKYLESKGDVSAAITNFEKSKTVRFEVPRMLYDDVSALENYILAFQDKKLIKWWAQYMESTGEMETAIQFYEKADDCLSLVRVYCYCDNMEKAAELASETGNRAACYHMGRQFEIVGNIKEAVMFFERAEAFGNAIRICKEHNLEDQLLNLALMGGSAEMLDVARYYEKRPDQVEKAVMLYQKGGLLSKATELALKSGCSSALELLSSELDDKTDPSILRQCARYFVDNDNPKRAVELLAKAKDYLEAVSLCLEQNIVLSEELAELISPPKGVDPNVRIASIERIAECCYAQGNYYLATKKFTQAGDKVKAMKSLLKSGDTDRIIFFANVSRQKEIYVMAANYLQTLEWKDDQELMKNIVAFYTKGKAPELLAGFYESCAQLEMDEYHDYTKAYGALSEAYNCLSSAKETSTTAVQQRIQRLRSKQDFVKKFIHAKRIYEDDPSESLKICQSLLNYETEVVGIAASMPLGDIYAFIVAHYARNNNFKMAYNVMEEMKSKLHNVNVSKFVDKQTLESLAQNLNLNSLGPKSTNALFRQNPSVESDDYVAEEVNE